MDNTDGVLVFYQQTNKSKKIIYALKIKNCILGLEYFNNNLKNAWFLWMYQIIKFVK